MWLRLHILKQGNRIVLPIEWRETMRPLQDRCEPTPYEDIEKLVVTDMGRPINEVFDEFNPEPIGVASLAQVHIGRWKESGALVAVKVVSCDAKCPRLDS